MSNEFGGKAVAIVANIPVARVGEPVGVATPVLFPASPSAS